MINKLKSLLLSKTALDALIVLGGSGFSSLFGFIFVFLVANRMSVSEFGQFSTIVNYVVFLSAVVDIGISQSLTRFVQEEKDDKNRAKWLTNGLASVLITSIALGLVATVFYALVLTRAWEHPQSYSVLIFPSVFIITLAIFFLGFFQALRKFWLRAFVDNVFSVVRLVIIGLIIYFGILNIHWAMISIILSYVVSVGISFLIGKKWINVKVIAKEKIGHMLAFSKWLAGINLFGNLYGKLDVMMLAWLSSAYVTGIYSAAARFILIFPLVVSSLSSVIAPRFASFKNKKEMHGYFLKSIGISFGLVGIMSILILIAKPLILIPYSEKFVEAIGVFQLLVAAYFPLILSIPATNAIVYYFKKPKVVTSISLVQLVGLISLNIILIPRFELYGPVFTLIAMNTVGMGLQYIMYFKLNMNSQNIS